LEWETGAVQPPGRRATDRRWGHWSWSARNLGLVDFEEPVPRVRLGGMIVKDGAKMSKRRGDVISPDAYVERYGMDVLRCSLLFTSP
jgi:leucyl-tRNA synthetase